MLLVHAFVACGYSLSVAAWSTWHNSCAGQQQQGVHLNILEYEGRMYAHAQEGAFAGERACWMGWWFQGRSATWLFSTHGSPPSVQSMGVGAVLTLGPR